MTLDVDKIAEELATELLDYVDAYFFPDGKTGLIAFIKSHLEAYVQD